MKAAKYCIECGMIRTKDDKDYLLHCSKCVGSRTFIDFITEAQLDPKLLKTFIEMPQEEGQYVSFFRRYGYSVSLEECSKILTCLVAGVSARMFIESY